MPITARPDPNNPGQWIWVDQQTGAPAVQPGGQGTAFVAPSDLNDQQRQQLGLPPKNPPTTQTQTGPVQGPTQVPDITKQDAAYQAVVQTARDDIDRARQDVLTINQNITDTQNKINALQGGTADPGFPALQSSLTSLYNQQSQAQLKLATSSQTFADVATKAIDSASLTGVTADKAKADAAQANAEADYARAQADVLTKGSPSQIALAENEAAEHAAAGRLDDANAGRIKALQPAEVDQLNAQVGQLKAQATSLQAQADRDKATAGLTDTQNQLAQAKVATAGRAAEATTQSLEAQAAVDKNKVQGLPTAEQQQAINQLAVGQAQANVGLTNAQAGAQQANAAATNAGVQQKLLGPAYGLDMQIDAIRKIQQQVFGPGGSGNPQDADGLLQQFFTASVGGTTIADAAKAAAQQQGANYQTQMGGVNALQSAMASRAKAFGSMAGSALGQMAQMNAYAPRGSTAGAAAYREVMDDMASRLASSQFAPVQLPQSPDLPQFLQAFTAGNQIGKQQGAAAAQQQNQGQQGQNPTISINVNRDPGFTSGAPNLSSNRDPGFTQLPA